MGFCIVRLLSLTFCARVYHCVLLFSESPVTLRPESSGMLSREGVCRN